MLIEAAHWNRWSRFDGGLYDVMDLIEVCFSSGVFVDVSSFVFSSGCFLFRCFLFSSSSGVYSGVLLGWNNKWWNEFLNFKFIKQTISKFN